MDPAGRFVGVGWNAEPIAAKRMENSYFASGTEDAVRMTAACFYSTSSAMLMRKSDLVASGGYDSRLKSAADWDLYLRMLQRCDAAFLAEPLAYYRSRPVCHAVYRSEGPRDRRRLLHCLVLPRYVPGRSIFRLRP